MIVVDKSSCLIKAMMYDYEEMLKKGGLWATTYRLPIRSFQVLVIL